jgi:hypothetical protein
VKKRKVERRSSDHVRDIFSKDNVNRHYHDHENISELEGSYPFTFLVSGAISDSESFLLLTTTTIKIMTSPRPSCLKQEGSTSSNMARLVVCFSEMVVYSFAYELGDNPNVREGAPLTIGWKHTKKNAYDINHFEFVRKSRPRRCRKELVLNCAQRDAMLLGLGYSMQEIDIAAQEAQAIRVSRLNSIKNSTWSKFRSIVERTKETMPRLIAGRTA